MVMSSFVSSIHMDGTASSNHRSMVQTRIGRLLVIAGVAAAAIAGGLIWLYGYAVSILDSALRTLAHGG